MARYTGPTIPTIYDPQWQSFTNLTPAQIQWYQSHRLWLIYYAQQRSSLAMLTSTPTTVDAIATAGVDLINQASAKKITTMDQIDTAIASIAPNSPSAKGAG